MLALPVTPPATITGRSAGLIVSRAVNGGKVDVLVDGRRAGTVNLRGKAAYRQIVWTRAFTGSARHTITVVALGSAVTVDGLVYLR